VKYRLSNEVHGLFKVKGSVITTELLFYDKIFLIDDKQIDGKIDDK